MSETPSFENIVWARDPAASGWRSRAWLPLGELIVYDDGAWNVCLRGAFIDTAHDSENNAELGKRRAYNVYLALTQPLPESTGVRKE